jgi:hypothetical protein
MVTLFKHAFNKSMHISTNDKYPKFISLITNNSDASVPVYLKQDNELIQSQNIYCANSCITCH